MTKSDPATAVVVGVAVVGVVVIGALVARAQRIQRERASADAQHRAAWDERRVTLLGVETGPFPVTPEEQAIINARARQEGAAGVNPPTSGFVEPAWPPISS